MMRALTDGLRWTFVFVFEWMGYHRSGATSGWWFVRGRGVSGDISDLAWWWLYYLPRLTIEHVTTGRTWFYHRAVMWCERLLYLLDANGTFLHPDSHESRRE